jgi:hypothetical protein
LEEPGDDYSSDEDEEEYTDTEEVEEAQPLTVTVQDITVQV